MFIGATTKILFMVLFLSIVHFNDSVEPPKNASALLQNAPDLDDPLELLYGQISDEAYFNLPSLQAKDKQARRLSLNGPWKIENVAQDSELQFERDNSPPGIYPPWAAVDTDRYNNKQSTKQLGTLHPDAFTIFHLCYAATYLYRKGSKRISRHNQLRDIYAEHLQFELGYMTQVIMSTYQNVLELYEYSTRMEGPENKIGAAHLFYFYKNILEDCKKIIHLNNMMHEATRKYRVLQYSEVGKKWLPVPVDESKKFQDLTGNYQRAIYFDDKRDYERGIQGFEYQKLSHEDPKLVKLIKKAGLLNEAEKIRKKQMAKPKRQDFILHGSFSWNTTLRTSRPTRTWKRREQRKDYGWSDEDF